MENTIFDEKPALFRPALNYALLISVAIIILSLVFYLAGSYTHSIHYWLAMAIFGAGLLYASVMFRKDTNHAPISYWRMVGFNTLTGLLTGILTGIFAYILLGFIAPDLLEQMRTDTIIATESMHLQINPNISSEELDQFVKISLWMVTPLGVLLQMVFSRLFYGFVFGLVYSIFLKRKAPKDGLAV